MAVQKYSKQELDWLQTCGVKWTIEQNRTIADYLWHLQWGKAVLSNTLNAVSFLDRKARKAIQTGRIEGHKAPFRFWPPASLLAAENMDLPPPAPTPADPTEEPAKYLESAAKSGKAAGKRFAEARNQTTGGAAVK